MPRIVHEYRKFPARNLILSRPYHCDHFLTLNTSSGQQSVEKTFQYFNIWKYILPGPSQEENDAFSSWSSKFFPVKRVGDLDHSFKETSNKKTDSLIPLSSYLCTDFMFRDSDDKDLELEGELRVGPRCFHLLVVAGLLHLRRAKVDRIPSCSEIRRCKERYFFITSIY